MSSLRLTLAFAFGAALVGCGGSDARRTDLSGRVTFKGQPVPRGKVFFTPDAKKGNTGPQGFADIENGSYDTRRPGSQGHAGGPMVVQIDGFDGNPKGDFNLGLPLFLEHYVTLELPKDTTSKDFDVPATAARTVPKQTGPAP